MANRKLIEVIGDKEVIDALRNSDGVVNKHGSRLLDRLGGMGVGMVKARTMDAGAVDTGALVQGIHFNTHNTLTGIETVIAPSPAADKYAAAMEYGTKPHFPPVSAIQGWADRHGIPAFAVAAKIARDGTKPRWMWRDAFEDLNDRAEGEVVRWVNNLMREL